MLDGNGVRYDLGAQGCENLDWTALVHGSFRRPNFCDEHHYQQVASAPVSSLRVPPVTESTPEIIHLSLRIHATYSYTNFTFMRFNTMF